MDDKIQNTSVTENAPACFIPMSNDLGSSNTDETRKKRPRIDHKLLIRVCLGVMGAIAVILIIYHVVTRQVASSQNATPGLEFIPIPDPDHTDNTLIHYKTNDKASVLQWARKIDNFLEEYHERSRSYYENRVACAFHSGAMGEQACDVRVDEFHPCVSTNQYNYGRAAPCVFLKLNKILNWVPQPYNSTEELPSNMPDYLKQHITMVSGKLEANVVWVSCKGESAMDEENIGPLQYIPRRGFPSYYFPFTNQQGYSSPVVAVLFERPMTDIVISIECKAWAKNIKNDRYEQGSVHFELMVDQ